MHVTKSSFFLFITYAKDTMNTFVLHFYIKCPFRHILIPYEWSSLCASLHIKSVKSSQVWGYIGLPYFAVKGGQLPTRVGSERRRNPMFWKK